MIARFLYSPLKKRRIDVSPSFSPSKKTCTRLPQLFLRKGTRQHVSPSSSSSLHLGLAEDHLDLERTSRCRRVVLSSTHVPRRARRSWVFTNLSFAAQSCTSLPVDHGDLGPSAQPLNRRARSWLPVLLAALARRSSCRRRVFPRWLRSSSTPHLLVALLLLHLGQSHPLGLPAFALVECTLRSAAGSSAPAAVKLTTSSSAHVLFRARQPIRGARLPPLSPWLPLLAPIAAPLYCAPHALERTGAHYL